MGKNKMVKVEMELPAVPGFEYTGEYRSALVGECVLVDVNNREVKYYEYGSGAEFPIMRKAAVWREARPSDLENGPVVCRYSNSPRDIETNPEIGYFCGYDAIQGTEYPFAVMSEADGEEAVGWFRYCHVEDNA